MDRLVLLFIVLLSLNTSDSVFTLLINLRLIALSLQLFSLLLK
jgi:hypothetical protein